MKRCPHCSTIMYLSDEFCHKCRKEVAEEPAFNSAKSEKNIHKIDSFLT